MASSLVSKIEFAVFGVGLTEPGRARTEAKHNAAELVALINPILVGAVIATYPGGAHYKAVKEGLQSSREPDAAIICKPNHMHVAVTSKCPQLESVY